MMAKGCAWTFLLFFVVGGAVAAMENYMDYGNEAANADKSGNLRELYKLLLLQHGVDDSESLRDLAEHLQPRAVERSPSLRLRFGRSYPKYPRSPSLRLRFGRSYTNPVDLVSRLNGGSPAVAFEEN